MIPLTRKYTAWEWNPVHSSTQESNAKDDSWRGKNKVPLWAMMLREQVGNSASLGHHYSPRVRSVLPEPSW